MTRQPIALVGGLVLDPRTRRFANGTVRIVEGRIAPADVPVAGEQVIDASGLLVTPGLIDLHTHVFRGQDLGIDADRYGPPNGVTTMVDTGSAGGHLFDAFRELAIDHGDVRIRAFVNIATVGTTSIFLSGELRGLRYCDEDVAAAVVDRHRDVVVGVKVRASADVAGDDAPEALRRARRVADRVGLPLMVHLGPAPATVQEVASTLRSGDILTHSCTGWGNSITLDGAVRPEVAAARARGALLDLGHGQGGFDSEVTRTLIELGEPPDTISTDLHQYSLPFAVGMTKVLSKMLALGMEPADLFSRATLAPAAAVGLDREGVGTLDPGAPGDVAVFRIDPVDELFQDRHGHEFRGDRRVVSTLTILGGRIVHEEARAG